MKLRNKKTGEIWEFMAIQMDGTPKTNEATRGAISCFADSLAELNEEWEDYEEPKETALEEIVRKLESDFEMYPDEWNNLEEAEKAVEKLKAWKRLKDKGLKFCGWKITDDGCSVDVETTLDAEIVRAQQKYITDDLNLLFEGEE